MSDGRDDTRLLVADASVFITLAGIDLVDVLTSRDGRVVIPRAVADEITDDPARSALDSEKEDGSLEVIDVQWKLVDAAEYLGKDITEDEISGKGHRRVEGDVAILGLALRRKGEATGEAATIVVTDDKPLREACKALSIPVSGSVGLVVRAVDQGTLTPAEAKEKLYAMDQIGARLSASLVRRAEQLIDEAADD